MGSVFDANIQTRLLRVNLCNAQPDWAAVFANYRYGKGALSARVTYDDRPDNFAAGRLQWVIFMGGPIVGVRVSARALAWDQDLPDPIPAILDDMDQLLRSPVFDDSLRILRSRQGGVSRFSLPAAYA